MTTGRTYLLDTNIIIDLFENDKIIQAKLSRGTVVLPSVVVGELSYGAYLSSKRELRLKEIVAFIAGYKILDIDKETADYYGRIKADLRKQGTPIPENDIWISALGAQHDLIVATRDKHFDRVRGLKVENW